MQKLVCQPECYVAMAYISTTSYRAASCNPSLGLTRCAAHSMQLRKPIEAYGRIRWYKRDRRDKVPTDNPISVPLDNSIINQLREIGQK